MSDTARGTARDVTTPPPLSRPATGAAIAVLIVLALSYAVNAADRQVFPVLLPSVDKALGFDLPTGGLLATIFTLGIGLAGIPTGRILDRLSRKTVMLVGIAAYSLFTVLTPLSFGFADMAVYRTASGVGEAFQNAALFSAVGAFFYARRSLALGVLNVSYGLGGFLGPFIGGKLLAGTGDWKPPMYLFGVIGFAFVLIVLFGVSKKFTEHEDVVRDISLAEKAAALPGTLLNRNSVLLCFAAAMGGLSLYSYLGLYPTFLQTQLHFSPSEAGLASSMFGIGTMVMSIPAGFLGDRFGNKLMTQIAFGCAIIVAALMFMVAKDPTTQCILSFAEGAFGSGFVYVNLYSALQRSIRAEVVGRASGAFITFFYLPSALSGYLFASLVGGPGWGAAALVQLMLVPLIGVVLLAFVKLPKPQLETAADAAAAR